MKFPIKLLDDLVAVVPEDINDRGPILLPDWQRTYHGKVLAIGTNTPEIKIGDNVVFGAAKGMDGVFDGKNVRIMRFDDIELVIER